MKPLIGCLLKQVTDKIKTSADASLKDQNITLTQARVLDFISSQGGKTTQKAIEEYLGVSHPTVVGLVSRMEKGGYLVCYYEQDGRRNKVVALTDVAAEISDEMHRQMNAHEEKLLKNLSQEESKELFRLLSIVYNNIN